MAKKVKEAIEKNTTTEEKIKEAARRVFTQKGYAATRTRDIAEESGLNLALINYYFRSKEKLYDLIMLEHVQLFIQSVMGLLNDKETTLQQKIEAVVSHYIDMLVENPDLPLFILSAVNADPDKLFARLGVDKITNHDKLYIVKQWTESPAGKKKMTTNPIHFLMNMAALTIFPFLGSPIIRNRTGLSVADFNKLMEERKKLVPVWIHAMINASL